MIGEKEEFEITEDHLKLMDEFVVGWNPAETGAPEIDPKRPYGNTSVENDMVKILGMEELKPGVYRFTIDGEEYILKGDKKGNNISFEHDSELVDKLMEIHKETETALEICLERQEFETGKFEKDGIGGSWEKIE